MASKKDVPARLPFPSQDCPVASRATSTDPSIARRTSHSEAVTSAGPASSAARSIAAAARSTLSPSGRYILSPADKSRSSSCGDPKDETRRFGDAVVVSDPFSVMASAAGSLAFSRTSSVVKNASSSLGSLLFASHSSSASKLNAVDKRRSGSEEVAAKASTEVRRRVTVQQRMTILEELVQYRRSDWNYLKTMHEGSNYWLNVALLREQQVMKYLGDKQSVCRAAQFFYLGIGLGQLIGDSRHGKLLASDCCQLLEELEFHFSSSTVQGMKMMVATASTLHEHFDKKNSPECFSDEPFRPSMHKWNQRPVYRRLLTSPIPFPLDYREVLLSLCDILALVYSKLIGDSSASENVGVFQSIIRFDDRIKKLFIDPVKKEFTAVASQVIAEEMRLVRKSYASGSRNSEGSSCAFATSVSATASDPDNASQHSQ